MVISGYTLGEGLHRSHRTTVVRAIRDADQHPVIVKLSSGGAGAARRRARARLEYEILSRLDVEGVIGVHELIAAGDSVGVVVADPGLVPLSQSIGSESWTVLDVVRLAIETTRILGEVHAAGVVHRDLNPSNIVVHPRTRRPTLIDFDVSTTLASERSRPWGTNSADGTPLYMSPEQTGRMNRPVDYRSDYYSLGATLYEILTGRPPFEAADSLSIVHAHIARLPTPPHEVSADVPNAVSRIVLKLLAKNAEDRYQTPEGLLADLEACEETLRGGGVPDFEVGRDDVSATFRIPEKLYGREAAFAALDAELHEVVESGTRIVLIQGEAGIGKTALVSELYRPLARRRGYFASGKFDQFNQGMPHTALVAALRDLVRQLLIESEAQIVEWRRQLQEALGGAAQAIVDLIPELELILGPSPPVPEVSGIETQNRMNLLLQRTLGVFATPEHPLVLFIDDLQWADGAFFKLLEVMQTSGASLLLVGAYRSEEVDAGHPLQASIESLREIGAPLRTIVLDPLTADDVDAMISETLGAASGESGALSGLVHRKTGGNPFFVRQLLATLQDRGLIVFDAGARRWLWNAAEIERVGVTDNVVHLMLDRLRDLPERAQAAVRWAACVGHVCDLRTIAMVVERSEWETARDLLPAVEDGLLIPVGDGYRLLLAGLGGEDADPEVSGGELEVRYRFLHDRVQQAAYALIPESDRAGAHLRIGRSLYARRSDVAGAEELFALVNHLNHALAEIHQRQERVALAELNLVAGRKAKASTAYGVAQRYLSAGVRLLPADAWDSEYELALGLHSEGAEAAYLNADVLETDAFIQEVFRHARTQLDKARVYETRIQAQVARQQVQEAVDTSLEALAGLGLRLPTNPGTLRVLAGFVGTKLALRGRTTEDLRDLPAMSDPTTKAIMRILMIATAPVYFGRPTLFPFIAFEMVKLSVRHGNAPYSAYGYGIFGVLLCAAFKDIPGGYSFGKLGFEVMEALEARDVRAKVNLVFQSSIKPWSDPLEETLAPLEEGYGAGLETGDTEYATLSGVVHCIRSMYAGRELGPISAKMDFHIDSARRFGQEQYLLLIRLARQTLEGLVLPSSRPWLLQGEFFGGEAEVRLLEEAKYESTLCMFYVFQGLTSVLFGETQAAIAAGAAAEPYLPAQTGTPHPAAHHFYTALALLEALREDPATAPSGARRKAKRYLKALTGWAVHAPANFAHRADLVAAEWARLDGDETVAMSLFDQAITGAATSGYTQDEALANEIAGKFHLAGGRPQIARVYLSAARDAWARWGARAKVVQLDRGLGRAEAEDVAASGVPATTRSGSVSGDAAAVDLDTVVRATRSITSELDLPRLLRALIDLVIRNAGAQRGFLLLEDGGRLFVEARQEADGSAVVAGAEPLEGDEGLCVPIVKYVARTRESVILHEASRDRLFGSDPYVQRTSPRSILCSPLLDKNRLVGVLYLENNLTSGAFTEGRIELLQILSAQIALSLQNARLYQNLEAKVAERTEQLAKSNADLTLAMENLQATQAQLIHSEKMASLGELTAGIAHEIKNPLNFVNNFAENLDEMVDELVEEMATRTETPAAAALVELDDLFRDLKAAAQMVAKHGKRADSIVKGMMRHSRTSGATRTRIALNALVEQYVNLARHGTTNRGKAGVELVTAFDGGIGEVEVVEQEIGRVLINLLDNAIDAVTSSQDDDAGVPTVEVVTRRDGDWAEVEVRDNGPGVPDEVRERIFEPFFTTKPAGAGTGLGLSLAYEIVVKQHGGQMELLDHAGAGATFVVRLPVATGATPSP